MVLRIFRYISIFSALFVAHWSAGETFLAARDWRDASGQTINAQAIEWDASTITVIRPGVFAANGKPQEFKVPIARLCPTDQAYAKKLSEIKTRYELKFRELKLEFPTEEVMKAICQKLEQKGIFQQLHIPDDQLLRRYRNLSNDLQFDNFEYEMGYLRKSLDSDTADYDQDTAGRGTGPIAKQYQENLKWIRVYLNPYLNKLTDQRKQYLDQILAIPVPDHNAESREIAATPPKM